MYIEREINDFYRKRMFDGKVVIVYGPRQTGKTTSVEHYLEQNGLAQDVVTFNGDELRDRELLADASVDKLRLLIGRKRIVFIDEAHKVPEIGMVLKRFADRIKGVQVIATGSSSEELADKTEEPLTGRKFEYTLLPLSFGEMAAAGSPMDEMRQLERRMVFGAYPDVVTHPGDEIDRLKEIGKGYLYKDVLKYGEIKKPDILDRLLRALAFQTGQEIVLSELSTLIGCDIKTVGKYIDILEKAFIVFRLGSFARNLRNELKKSSKIYFRDCGIRNFVLGDWRSVDERSADEVGHLWENYVISQRIQRQLIREPECRSFYWRTTQQQEVDYVEESGSDLRAFEVKWNPRKAEKAISRTFRTAYPNAVCQGLSPKNYMDILL